MTLRAFTLASCVVLGSCSRPHFQPRETVGPLPVQELVQRADAVIVGTLAKLDLAAKPREGACLALMQVQLQIENVLKGRISNRTVEYYYFGPWCGTTGPVELPKLGSRSIFFLNQEQKLWRAVADYWQNRLPVASGRHSDEFAAGQSVEQAIANTLLIPGDHYSAFAFAFAIQTGAASTARTLAGPARTEKLLRLLLNHPDMGVRAAACLDLKQNQAVDRCADPILSWYLDRFARADFTGVSDALVSRLESLSSYAEPEVRLRSEYLLYQARVATTLPRPPEVTLPDVLVR